MTIFSIICNNSIVFYIFVKDINSKYLIQMDFDSVYTWLSLIISILTAILGVIGLFFTPTEE